MRNEIKDSTIIIISHQERILRIADEVLLLSVPVVSDKVEDVFGLLAGTGFEE